MGACIINQGRVDEFGDFWDASDSRPIHVKKASVCIVEGFIICETGGKKQKGLYIL